MPVCAVSAKSRFSISFRRSQQPVSKVLRNELCETPISGRASEHVFDAVGKESLSYRRKRINSFYAPVLNAHYFHVAGDSRDNGVIWVYRHKQ